MQITRINPGGWVIILPSPTTAAAFLDFIGKPEALDDGVQYYFRPSQNGAATLSARLGPNAHAQFQPQFTTIELPPYDALNEAAAQWHSDVKSRPAKSILLCSTIPSGNGP